MLRLGNFPFSADNSSELSRNSIYYSVHLIDTSYLAVSTKNSLSKTFHIVVAVAAFEDDICAGPVQLPRLEYVFSGLFFQCTCESILLQQEHSKYSDMMFQFSRVISKPDHSKCGTNVEQFGCTIKVQVYSRKSKLSHFAHT